MAVLEIAKYNQDSLLISQMTRKEVVQSQIDFYNSVLSSVVMGGLIGLILLTVQIFQSSTPVNGLLSLGMAAAALTILGVIGFVISSYRNEFLQELYNMPP